VSTTYGSGDGSTTFNLPNIPGSGAGSPVYYIKAILSGDAAPASVAHASSHIRTGSDVIDGDRVQVDYVPSYYTRDSSDANAGANTDLAAHLKGVDNYSRYGHITCTSGTRPASPVAGQMIYETDTGYLYLYTNGAWQKISTADDQAHAYAYYNSGVTFAANANTKIPFDTFLNNKNVTLSSGSFVFARTGIYEVTLGMRLGTGGDIWTGVNLYNASTATVLARSYGTGNVVNDPGPVSWQFLVNITSTTNLHDIRVYRAGGTLATVSTDASAGYVYTCSFNKIT
jgi:hypothetical protein